MTKLETTNSRPSDKGVAALPAHFKPNQVKVENEVRSSKTTDLFGAAALTIAFVFLAAPAAIAQNEPSENTVQKTAASKPNEPVTRTRRVSDDSKNEAPTEDQLKPASDATEVAPETTAAPQNKIAALRDEIAGTSNEQERARLRLKLANHLAEAGMKPEALSELRSMSAEDLFDPQGLYNVANAQARMGDSEAAVVSYRKAIDQRKGRYSRAYNNLGVVLLRLGRWDEAYESLMSALRLENFNYAEASYNLGRLYDARGENDLAAREWRRALAIDPNHLAAKNALARAGSAGEIRVARTPASAPSRVTEKSTRRLPESERPPSNSTPADKPREKPSRESSPAFSVDPETYAFLKSARAARDRSRHGEAVENYRRVLARMDGYFAPANLELSYALISLKRNDEAIVSLLPIVKKDGTRFPIAYYHLARLYDLRGDLRLVEENFSQVAESYGESNVQFLLDLTRVRERLGNLSGALASLERYLSVMERQGQKPNWADERLGALRQKIAATR
ncbi:MAG: tetratricopeptide repeat protein [Pyrinomonadaceae bacterium]